MVRCCCVVISLCITHALGCETSGFQALPRGDQDCLRHRDKQRWEGSWTGDNTGLSRARGGLRSVRAVGLGISYRGRKTHSGDSSWISGKRDARDSANVLEAARRIARYRAGADRGYDYDDEYYGGPPGEDPYYDDPSGWGEDTGGRGRQGDRYEPYGDRRASKRGRGSSGSRFDLTGTITRGNKMYGVYALAGSVLLTMMGISLMFEKNLIRLGNMGFLAGVALLIGPSNVVRYFTQTSKLRGAIIFALGFFFVFTGHPIIGLAIEVFGFLNLFGNMLPMFWAMASNMPFVKDIVNSGASRRKSSGKKRRKRSTPPPSRYYDDGYGYEEDDWDNNGGGDWGYEDYDYYPNQR